MADLAELTRQLAAEGVLDEMAKQLPLFHLLCPRAGNPVAIRPLAPPPSAMELARRRVADALLAARRKAALAICPELADEIAANPYMEE